MKKIEINRAWKRLIDSAREKKFISFHALARYVYSDPSIDYEDVRFPMIKLLDRVALISVKLSETYTEPVIITAIVTSKELVDEQVLSESNLEGFLKAAREAGIPVPREKKEEWSFSEKHKMLTYKWALHAPNHIPPDLSLLSLDPC